MGVFKDLSGKTYGELTVKYMERHPLSNDIAWVCQCSCGNITKPIKTANLNNGNTTKCVDHPFRNDLTGKRFGMLKVIKYCPESSEGLNKTYWICQCDCGKMSTVRSDLLQAKIRSCGCNWHAAHNSIKGKELRKTDWYNNYLCARNRSLNPNNPQYKIYDNLIVGEKFEKEWIDNPFSFIEHIGPRPSSKHSIDRIDNTKGYIKGNVRWATHLEQSKNKRIRKNRTIDSKLLKRLGETFEGVMPEHFDKKYCVYSFWKDDLCVYIGKSRDFSSRIRRHLLLSSNLPDEELLSLTNVKVSICKSVHEMDEKERYYINDYNPKYNVRKKKQISNLTFEEDWINYVPKEYFRLYKQFNR